MDGRLIYINRIFYFRYAPSDAYVFFDISLAVSKIKFGGPFAYFIIRPYHPTDFYHMLPITAVDSATSSEAQPTIV